MHSRSTDFWNLLVMSEEKYFSGYKGEKKMTRTQYIVRIR